MKKVFTKNIKWIILGICTLCFILLAIGVLKYNTNFAIDNAIYSTFSKSIIRDVRTPIVKILTKFGGVIFSITITLIVAISSVIIKNKKIGLCIFLNLIISSGLNFLLKNILRRQRPIGIHLIEESGYSFPSGHSMVSCAVYGFFIYLIYKGINGKKRKIGMITVLTLIVFIIGITRIYLGVHYASDVIGGFLLGVIYLIIYTSIIKKVIEEEFNDEEIEYDRA